MKQLGSLLVCKAHARTSCGVCNTLMLSGDTSPKTQTEFKPTPLFEFILTLSGKFFNNKIVKMVALVFSTCTIMAALVGFYLGLITAFRMLGASGDAEFIGAGVFEFAVVIVAAGLMALLLDYSDKTK